MFTSAAFDTAAACPPLGSGGDPVGELRRQSVLVDDLMHRVSTVVTALPDTRAIEGWWGPAQEAFQQSLGIERARLARQVERLYGVRAQLELAAGQAAILKGGLQS